MNFYHNLITQKSWDLLKRLHKECDFILIGGWAVFLYTKALKSKDIDIVSEYRELERLKLNFEVSKNERLKKYEARAGEVEIDVYVPFYSNPGLPAEVLRDFQETIEGFKIVRKEVLAILKQKALRERADTVKGRKDLIDLVSLFSLNDFNWASYKRVCLDYKLGEYLDFVKETIKKVNELEELDLNVHQMSRLKRKILPNFSDQ